MGEGSHSATVENHYRQFYFEFSDLAIASISDPGYAIYENIESLIVSAANCDPLISILRK